MNVVDWDLSSLWLKLIAYAGWVSSIIMEIVDDKN